MKEEASVTCPGHSQFRETYPCLSFLYFSTYKCRAVCASPPMAGDWLYKCIHFCLDQPSNLNFLVTVEGKLQWNNVLLPWKNNKEEVGREADMHLFPFRQVLFTAVTNKYRTVGLTISSVFAFWMRGCSPALVLKTDLWFQSEILGFLQ